MNLSSEEIGLPELGVSFGVAGFREKGFENETTKEFTKRADYQMYADKSEKDKRSDPNRNDRTPKSRG